MSYYVIANHETREYLRYESGYPSVATTFRDAALFTNLNYAVTEVNSEFTKENVFKGNPGWYIGQVNIQPIDIGEE